MFDLSTVFESMEDDINGVSELSDKLYSKHFGNYFKIQQDLYKRIQNNSEPVTDTELEKVLTELPLELIEVSESLSKFQIGQEVVKLRTKEESASKTSLELKEYELMSKIYASVSERVARQISFSRELIMSCKKIWDRRKDTDIVTPIGPVDTSLPEYVPPAKQTYVK